MWVPGWYLNQKHRTRRCDASERIRSGLTEPAGGWAAKAQITSGPGGENAPTPEGRGLGEAGSLSRLAGADSLSLARTGGPSPRVRTGETPPARRVVEARTSGPNGATKHPAPRARAQALGKGRMGNPTAQGMGTLSPGMEARTSREGGSGTEP